MRTLPGAAPLAGGPSPANGGTHRSVLDLSPSPNNGSVATGRQTPPADIARSTLNWLASKLSLP